MAGQISRMLVSGMRFVLASRKAALIGIALALCIGALLLPDLAPAFVAVAVALLLILVAVLGARLLQEQSRLAELQTERSLRSAPSVASPDATDYDSANRDMVEAAAALQAESGGEALVTVIVPCFDHAGFLPMALESLQRQLLQDWRCIVVDDGSTDNTSDVVASFAASDSRIAGITHHTNQGLSAARNTGLHAATTDFVCFLDADDFLTPSSLADRAITLAHADDPSIAGSYCGIVMVVENATLDSVAPLKAWSNPGIHDFVSTGGDCPFNCHAPMLRTQLVTDMGGFDETMLVGGEDWDLWLRMMRNGYYFVPSRFFGGAYRQRRSSMVRAGAQHHLEVSTGLLMSAHEPLASRDELRHHAAAYDQPVFAYQLKLALAKRSLQFAGITAVAGSIDEARRIIAAVDETGVSLADRHFSKRALLTSGVARGLGLTEPLLPDESQQVATIVDQVLA